MEFMPGAGGRKAANYMYHRARPDAGLTLPTSAVVTSSAPSWAKPEWITTSISSIYLGTPNTGSHYIFITMSRLGLNFYRQASGSCRTKNRSPRSGATKFILPADSSLTRSV